MIILYFWLKNNQILSWIDYPFGSLIFGNKFNELQSDAQIYLGTLISVRNISIFITGWYWNHMFQLSFKTPTSSNNLKFCFQFQLSTNHIRGKKHIFFQKKGKLYTLIRVDHLGFPGLHFKHQQWNPKVL